MHDKSLEFFLPQDSIFHTSEHFMLSMYYRFAKVQLRYGLCTHKHVCINHTLFEIPFLIHAMYNIHVQWLEWWHTVMEYRLQLAAWIVQYLCMKSIFSCFFLVPYTCTWWMPWKLKYQCLLKLIDGKFIKIAMNHCMGVSMVESIQINWIYFWRKYISNVPATGRWLVIESPPIANTSSTFWSVCLVKPEALALVQTLYLITLRIPHLAWCKCEKQELVIGLHCT